MTRREAVVAFARREAVVAFARREAVVAIAALAIGLGAGALGCGGKRTPPVPPPVGDAGDAAVQLADAAVAVAVDAAPPPPAGTAPPYQVIAVDEQTGGRLRVKVEWPTARAALRRSPGRTACGGARPPRARIGALHGVTGAVVVIDLASGKPAPAADDVRLIVRDCTVAPAIVLAPGLGGAVELQSQDELPHHLVVTDLGPAWRAAAIDAPIAAAALPMIGHTVTVPLAAATVLRVVADATDDAAYVIAPPHPYLAVTDDAGAAELALVPPGSYPVRAYLPAAGGQPAVTATGTAVITAGQDTDLTLTFAP